MRNFMWSAMRQSNNTVLPWARCIERPVAGCNGNCILWNVFFFFLLYRNVLCKSNIGAHVSLMWFWQKPQVLYLVNPYKAWSVCFWLFVLNTLDSAWCTICQTIFSIYVHCAIKIHTNNNLKGQCNCAVLHGSAGKLVVSCFSFSLKRMFKLNISSKYR